MTPYVIGNKFSPFISFADAVVVWAGLMPTEFPFVFLNDDGLPTHLDSRNLLERAEGLLIHIDSKCITGITHSKYGHLLPCPHIQLERESFIHWQCKRASI